jgi:hypothetical protein
MQLPQPLLFSDPEFLRKLFLIGEWSQVYRDFFEEKENRNWFRQHYQLEIYRPRIILLAGRDSSLGDLFDPKRLESYLRDFKILTYDDLLRIARFNAHILSGKPESPRPQELC